MPTTTKRPGYASPLALAVAPVLENDPTIPTQIEDVRAESLRIFTVEQFGGGVAAADNSVAFQAAINAASIIGGTVFFGAGTYRFRGAVNPTISGPVRIVGCGKKTVLDGRFLDASGDGRGGLYYDSYIGIQSQVTGTVKTAAGAVAIDQKTFTLSNVAGLAVGDTVWCELGSDPSDPGEDFTRFLDTITAIAGNDITVKIGSPEQVAAAGHRFQKVSAAAQNVIIENLSLYYLGLNVWRAQNISIRDIFVIEATAPFFFVEFNGLTFERVFCEYVHGVDGPNGLAWYGWFIQGWGMSALRVRDVIVQRLEGLPFLSIESQSRDISITDVKMGLFRGVSTKQVFAFGCQYDTKWQVAVTNCTIIRLDDCFMYSVGEVFRYHNLSIVGDTNAAGSSIGGKPAFLGINLRFHSGFLKINNRVYQQKRNVRRVIRPNLAAGGSNYDLGVRGPATSVRVFASHSAHVETFFMYGPSGEDDFAAGLVAGQWAEYINGSMLGGSNPTTETRSIWIATDGSFDPNGYFIIDMDYLVSPEVAEDVAEMRVGTGAPAANANFIGQEYLDSTAGVFYKAKAVGTGAADWV